MSRCRIIITAHLGRICGGLNQRGVCRLLPLYYLVEVRFWDCGRPCIVRGIEACLKGVVAVRVSVVKEISHYPRKRFHDLISSMDFLLVVVHTFILMLCYGSLVSREGSFFDGLGTNYVFRKHRRLSCVREGSNRVVISQTVLDSERIFLSVSLNDFSIVCKVIRTHGF